MSRNPSQARFDLILIILMIILMIFGVIMIYSASTTKIGDLVERENYYLKQIIWVVCSLLALVVILNIPPAFIEALVLPAYLINLILLVLVLFLPAIKGSHRWISLGFAGFQPSELAKLLTIILLAKQLNKTHITNLQILKQAVAVTILPLILILIEPDLGTAMTLLICVFTILAFSDLPFWVIVLIISPMISIVASFNLYFFLFWIAALVFYLVRQRLSLLLAGLTVLLNSALYFLVPFAWNSLKTYQQNRIITFINPLHDPFGAGYQIIQAKIAIGSGGWLGKGFLMGSQKNLQFLPEHHTDFIFSVIGEELGFFGCLFFLIIYFLFLMRLMSNVSRLKRKFMYYASVGIVANLVIMMFVNIGMNLGIVPATGIPLPFIAYGGTNLLFNTLAVGLIMKFAAQKSLFE
ncbi:MAG: rod shape-determining protein RodA [Candidatus Cloacimonetes bacterium]|nr:rod shape-determining protein RodA [Candidatus Cloacimonadota bacterium]